MIDAFVESLSKHYGLIIPQLDKNKGFVIHLDNDLDVYISNKDEKGSTINMAIVLEDLFNITSTKELYSTLLQAQYLGRETNDYYFGLNSDADALMLFHSMNLMYESHEAFLEQVITLSKVAKQWQQKIKELNTNSVLNSAPTLILNTMQFA